MTYKSNQLIPPHGGYKKLESYKMAVIICDATDYFCKKWIRDLKLSSQMNGAARSGKQCIVEGTLNSGTSKKLEIKLIGNARGSFGELLEDYEDFLRFRKLKLWEKDDKEAKNVRQLVYTPNRSYTTYKTYIENTDPEVAANTLICLIHQVNFLLDRQLKSLESQFLKEGGISEKMYWQRKNLQDRKEFLQNEKK
jgi:restriction system protein